MSAGPLKLEPGVMVMVTQSVIGNRGRTGVIEYQVGAGHIWRADGYRILDTFDGWMVRASGSFVIEIEYSTGDITRFENDRGSFRPQQLIPIAGSGIDTDESADDCIKPSVSIPEAA